MSKVVNWLNSNVLLLMILLLALALRLYHINFQSLWLDEIHTVNEANPALTLRELYTILCEADPHPPLFFLLAKLSFYLFGYTAITLRILSAVIGLAGVWSIYLLGKELYNKKAGLIGALLLAVNYFHIYYSQDGRPYALLFFCTTISFYYLAKFIKNPTLRSSLLYGFFAGLMLYTHLFALFGMIAQCVVLLYFVCKPYSHAVIVKKMFLYSLLSGLIVIFMYLPCLGILLSAASRTSFWIAKLKADVYLDVLSEFFGYYDIQLLFAGIVLCLFIVKLLNEKRKNIQPGILGFNGIILFTWIIIVLLIPFIKSYYGVSIIISRYFINILPAILLLIAIGILQFKNKLLQYGLTGIMVIISLYNIFIVKKYYHTLGKAQFREAIHFMTQRNGNNEPLITSLGWYMPFYLKQNNKEYAVTEKPLNDYVNEMAADTARIKSFWYLDAHGRPYNPTEQTKKFLADNFIVEDNFDGFDIWTRHYLILKDSKIDVSHFGKLKPQNGDKITSYVDVFEKNDTIIKANGWAIFDNTDSSGSKIKLCVIKDGKVTRISSTMYERLDLKQYFNFNTDNSGFMCEYNTTALEPGKYQLGIYMENKEHNKSGLVITDKFFIKNGL